MAEKPIAWSGLAGKAAVSPRPGLSPTGLATLGGIGAVEDASGRNRGTPASCAFAQSAPAAKAATTRISPQFRGCLRPSQRRNVNAFFIIRGGLTRPKSPRQPQISEANPIYSMSLAFVYHI